MGLQPPGLKNETNKAAVVHVFVNVTVFICICLKPLISAVNKIHEERIFLNYKRHCT